MIRDRIQIRNPVTDRWVKLDARTGRMLATKRTPGQWANIELRLAPGDVFTIPGVYRVDPKTKRATGALYPFEALSPK